MPEKVGVIIAIERCRFECRMFDVALEGIGAEACTEAPKLYGFDDKIAFGPGQCIFECPISWYNSRHEGAEAEAAGLETAPEDFSDAYGWNDWKCLSPEAAFAFGTFAKWV